MVLFDLSSFRCWSGENMSSCRSSGCSRQLPDPANGTSADYAEEHRRHHLKLVRKQNPPPPPTLPSASNLTMASTLRPALLRHALAAPSKRAFTTTSAALPAFRSQRQLQSVLRPSALVAQRAAFQTSQQRQILPPLPQKILGTVNDAVKTPEASPSHGSLHWSMER